MNSLKGDSTFAFISELFKGRYYFKNFQCKRIYGKYSKVPHIMIDEIIILLILTVPSPPSYTEYLHPSPIIDGIDSVCLPALAFWKHVRNVTT